MYASVSYIRLKTKIPRKITELLTHFSIILLISDQKPMKKDAESNYRTDTIARLVLVAIWCLFFLVLAYLIFERILYASVSCMTKKSFGLYLISERILYASVSYKRASTVLNFLLKLTWLGMCKLHFSNFVKLRIWGFEFRKFCKIGQT